MSNFISGTVNAVNTSIKYDDYTFGVQVNGATKLRNAITQGTITISGTLAANISASGGEMIALTSLKAQKGFLAGQAVGFIRAAINRCYQDADGKAVIVFNDNKISDFVCSETYSTVQTILATSIFSGGGIVIDANPTDGSVNAVSSNGVFDALATKQAALVSATNIKTVNGFSLLGSGDLVISGGSSLTEYGVAVSGGSGNITARMYGTSLITVTREAADTYRFNIPASGYAQSWELYLPSADNTVAGYTLKFVYASPTFNTNFQTMKPCIIQMMTDTGNVYVNRAAPAATDFANTPTIPTSGTLQHVVTVPSAIQGVVLKIVGKF